MNSGSESMLFLRNYYYAESNSANIFARSFIAFACTKKISILVNSIFLFIQYLTADDYCVHSLYAGMSQNTNLKLTDKPIYSILMSGSIAVVFSCTIDTESTLFY